MKYFRIHIDTDGTRETFHKISELLSHLPEIDPADKTPYDSWILKTQELGNGDPVDFIGNALDLLEPKLEALSELGIRPDNILFWLLYEYDQQCGLEFHPEEMLRLGKTGIHLNIDCWTNS